MKKKPYHDGIVALLVGLDPDFIESRKESDAYANVIVTCSMPADRRLKATADLEKREKELMRINTIGSHYIAKQIRRSIDSIKAESDDKPAAGGGTFARATASQAECKAAGPLGAGAGDATDPKSSAFEQAARTADHLPDDVEGQPTRGVGDTPTNMLPGH